MEEWQPHSVDDVLDILESRDDNQLLGVYETSWLDFKGAYHFDKARERWEFVKDVTALANSGGGLIVVGVQSKADPARDEERADAVKPFEHSRFDTKRARDFLDVDVYPPLQGVDMRVFVRGETDDRRLVAVVVPAQDPDLAPFMLTKTVDEQGDAWQAFAVPRRSGTHTAFQKVGVLHRDISDGRRSRTAGAVPDAAATLHELDPNQAGVLRAGDVAEPSSITIAEQWTQATADLLDREIGVTETAMLYLAAVPSGERPRPADFFVKTGLRMALSTKHTLRDSGFGLTYGQNITVGARSLTSIDEDRTLLRVDVGGHAVNGAAGTPDHLGWAQDRNTHTVNGRQSLRINVVALSEFVIEFCRFVERELASRWGRDGWVLVAAVRRAQSAERPLVLPGGYTPEAAWMFSDSPAESDSRVEGFRAELNPTRDAAVLLESIYGVFGLDVQSNPFVVDGHFDMEKLLAL